MEIKSPPGSVCGSPRALWEASTARRSSWRRPGIHEGGGCRPAADLLLRADALFLGVQVEWGLI